MKRVEKQAPPDWLEAWKQNFQKMAGRQAHYKGDFSTSDEAGRRRRRRRRAELTAEQGFICCYCMKRIFPDMAHIEHFLPKERFYDLDLDYQNLFASCNGEGTILLDEEHCGHRKDNWWSSRMVSPADAGIEEMFHYGYDGSIYSVKDRDTTAIAGQMIHQLGLDSYHLRRNRRQAIESSEVFDEENYSREDLQSFIDYYSHMDNGKYVPCCMAIVDCLMSMLDS